MVFYFTATGNSLYVAKQLEPRPVSIAQAVHDSEKVYRAERIGIVCPVFGHEMPELVKEFAEGLAGMLEECGDPFAGQVREFLEKGAVKGE